MSTTIGTLTNVTKNAMLNAFRDLGGGRSVDATNAAGDFRSDSVTISFNSSSNGKITLSSPVTLTVFPGSDGNDAIKKIFVTNNAVTQTYIEFELQTAIDFPNGGNLVINQLDVELEDPA